MWHNIRTEGAKTKMNIKESKEGEKLTNQDLACLNQIALKMEAVISVIFYDHIINILFIF